ncbi:MAG: sugar ABC transporter substrate-binding protein [Clostridiales bacterium]|nr:sugar ABC transporter substrate-binding protein [Clostridiales bacterium]
MKKKIAIVLAVLMVFSVALAACTATPDQPAGGGGSSSGGDSDLSAYDQLMLYQQNPETALALSGVQPREYPSRAHVNKALPVEPKAAGDIKIGWAAASLGSEFFIGMRDAGFARARELGMSEPDIQDANFNLETQRQQVDTFITNRVDAIILNAVDLHSSVQMMQEIVAAGIPVIVTGPTAGNPEYEMISAIISGSNESGYQIGLHCAEELYVPGEVLNVGMVVSKLEDADSNSRPCGWIAGWLYKTAEIDGTPYASKYDALLEAYYIWDDYKRSRSYDLSDKGLMLSQLGVGEGTDAAKGQAATADILIAEPNMDLLVVEMDSMAVGAIAEIKTQGKTPGQDLKVVTCADGTVTSLNFIRAGELMATATNIPFLNSVSMIDMIYNMFDATGTDKTQAEWCEYYNDMPATSFTPTMAVTSYNVDRYYPADPNDPIFGAFAAFDPWTPINISGYNALNASS